MGCDGGTIPKRDEMVRTKKKQAQTPKDIKNAAKWNHCRLSQLPLQKPVVADLLGNIYNKEAVIEHFLDKTKYEKAPENLKTLKDITELSLVLNPSYDSNKQENGHEMNMASVSQWICPITGLEMSGNFKFYFLYSCGCVFSDRAYKTIQTGNSKCIKCEKPFNDYDMITINPSEGELILNKNKLNLRKEATAKAKAEKSSSKASSSEIASKASTSDSVKKATSASESSSVKQKRSIDAVGPSTSSAAAAAAVSGQAAASASNSKKFKSIQEDPNASDVYKSLFNTSEKAKNQTKAHWVTYNPLFF